MDDEFLRGLEVEVGAELTIVESAVADPPADLPYGADAERYEVGLRGLLGAVEGMEERGRS